MRQGLLRGRSTEDDFQTKRDIFKGMDLENVYRLPSVRDHPNFCNEYQ